MKLLEITNNKRYICEYKGKYKVDISEEEFKAYQRRQIMKKIKKNYKPETKEELNYLIIKETKLLEKEENTTSSSTSNKSGSSKDGKGSSSATGKIKSFLNPHKTYTNYHKIR